jgi:hypothetical protein
MSDTLHLVGVTDLAERWSYTRQGVHKLAARPDFPAPLGAVNGGRIRVWSLADIEAFERDRPGPPKSASGSATTWLASRADLQPPNRAAGFRRGGCSRAVSAVPEGGSGSLRRMV